MFHNNWITYDYNNLTVNEYPNKNFRPTTFKNALKEQALVIAQDVKPAVFVSGGIDSQAIAFGFKSLNIDAEYIYIRSSYNGHYDKLEYFFVNEFCKRNHIDLQIIDLEFDKNSLRNFLLESEYFETGVGSGTVFLLEGIRRYKGDGFPVTADGHFIFQREGNLCKGVFKKPGLTLSHGIRVENQILFDLYYNFMFQYYEHMHRTTPEIQYLKKMEAKNLIYTHMFAGFPFRPKMSGWEFLDREHDYSTLSSIDWSNDHGKKARFTRGIEVIVDILDLPEEYIEKKLQYQWGDDDRFITLYDFESKYEYD